MSTSHVDQNQRCCDDYNFPTCRQPCRRTAAVQSFDLDAKFRRRFKLYDDDEDILFGHHHTHEEEQNCDYAVSPEYSEYSDDYTSMTGSGSSTTMLPLGQLDDRLAALSVSSGDSFSLYDPDEDDDDDDLCSISTLENVFETEEDQNATETGKTSPLLVPPMRSSAVEDLEFNFLEKSTTTTTVCRSASLKSTYGSTPPCSPRTKKVVRFADALGLDLESIRHILDVSDELTTSLGRSLEGPSASSEDGATMRLMARFSEPGSSVNFLRRVQERKVSLEEVSVDTKRRTVSGVVRVANIAYQKQVCLL